MLAFEYNQVVILTTAENYTFLTFKIWLLSLSPLAEAARCGNGERFGEGFHIKFIFKPFAV
jgi:hypothetical protein